MTEAQKIEYEAQGYLVLEGGLDSGELAEFRTAFDRVSEDDSLEDLPNGDDRFIHLALHPTFFPIVHRILSDDVQIRTLCGRVYTPGNEGMEWRREVAGLLGVAHEASTLCVQVHIHLDETPDNGTFIAVVPGSHRFHLKGRSTHARIHTWNGDLSKGIFTELLNLGPTYIR